MNIESKCVADVVSVIVKQCPHVDLTTLDHTSLCHFLNTLDLSIPELNDFSNITTDHIVKTWILHTTDFTLYP